jgi:hypothetical protein
MEEKKMKTPKVTARESVGGLIGLMLGLGLGAFWGLQVSAMSARQYTAAVEETVELVSSVQVETPAGTIGVTQVETWRDDPRRR